MTFNIKNYVINNKPAHYNDINKTDESQLEVYQFCLSFMKKNNYNRVIDVGCGSGYKLIKLLGVFDTVGIETEPCYSFLKKTYPLNKWLLSGESEKTFKNYDEINCSDVVICSDVIEHVINPDVLIDYLLSLKSKYYIISTPCREILCTHPRFKTSYIKSWKGPPRNPCHVREWTMTEFKQYISNKFNIISSHYGNKQIECQYHLLTAK